MLPDVGVGIQSYACSNSLRGHLLADEVKLASCYLEGQGDLVSRLLYGL